MRNRKSRARGQGSRARQARDSRRGVLLLVVLSMLVLFMLIGTAFLMSSNQSRTQMKEAARQDRLGNYATELLDRAMLQIVRDTTNPYSVIRYHSLLRDMYGTDGWQGVTYGFTTGDPTDLGASGQSARYAGATAALPQGPTNGQFIDIYFKQLGFGMTTPGSSEEDPQTQELEATVKSFDLRHVLKLDRDPNGNAQVQLLPPTKGYYNGCLLTITSGPAAGQSTRILDYEYLSDVKNSGTTVARIFRIRVMAFARKDGQPLQINPSRSPEIAELVGQTFMVNGRPFSGTGVGYNPLAAAGRPRLSALQLFPVTGTDFVGAEVALLPNAVYFNPLDKILPIAAAPADAGDPFLTQRPLETVFGKYTAGYFSLLDDPTTNKFLYPSFVGPGGANEGYDAADFQNIALALQTVTPRSQGRVVHKNSALAAATPTVTLDASDPDVLAQRKDFLRLDLEDVPMPSFHRPDLVNYWNHRLVNYLANKPNNPMQPEDAVRAVLQPYTDDKWTVNSTNAAGLTPEIAALISAIKRQTSLRPSRLDHPHFDGSNTDSISIPAPAGDVSVLSGLKDLTVGSSISIPTWDVIGGWDIDNDNDGVRDSIWIDLGDPVQQTEDGRRYKPLYAILCVDMDSRLNVNAHGLAEDLHMPHYVGNTIHPPLIGVVETPVGSGIFTAVRPSLEYGFIHQLNPIPMPYPPGPYGTPQPITEFAAGNNNLAGGKVGSLTLARGLGYGPAEISLRPVFPIPLENTSGRLDFRANRSEVPNASYPPYVDSYAALLVGRETEDKKEVSGRYGYKGQGVTADEGVSPGQNYKFTPSPLPGPAVEDLRAPDLATQIKFFDYPWRKLDYTNWRKVDESAFGTPPDLHGRYGLGLDYAGQPFQESYFDRNPNDVDPGQMSAPPKPQIYPSLLTDVPYELDLSSAQRRDSWATSTINSIGPSPSYNPITPTGQFQQSLAQNDDAAFSPTDLEKVLRGWDPESGTLPSRLWDVVNDFDPIKLINYNQYYVQRVAELAFNSGTPFPTGDPLAASKTLAAAQQIAGINRRLVTTDSYDLPVPNYTMPEYVSDFGPDGVPGRRGQPNQVLNAIGTDDFQAVVGVSRAQAKITDLLRYRVWLEARAYEMNRQNLTEAAIDAASFNYANFMNQIKARADFVLSSLPQLASDLLAPEVIAGKRMDLNRPFGNGKDDNGDGVVDDPLEAGEPFLDVNGNGKRDDGSNGTPVEPFLDLNGNNIYEGPGDLLWPQLAPAPVGNNTLGEPITFDYTNGRAESVAVNAINKAFASLSAKPKASGAVRNLDSEGRQRFARQLYCLMLLLVDANYIAPWDENDPQINKLLDITVDNSMAKRLRTALGASPDPQLDAQARAILLRRLTCRTIAQWAINCVDMRDPDVIMTPFEYDENPWDGWGVWDDNWNRDPVGDNANFITSTFIPLDGDPATNENDAWVIDWWPVPPPATGARTKTLLQLRLDLTTATSPANPPFVTHPFNQTRGVVWGAERPELLITETTAWHDRRTDDRVGDSQGKHDEMQVTTPNPDRYTDFDMDQHLRPKGYLYVEVYNPWSPNGQYPSELYSRLAETDWDSSKKQYRQYKLTPTNGVDLSRLSNWGVSEFYNTSNITNPFDARLAEGVSGVDYNDNTRVIKRSPVWRQIVVDDWPRVRNRDRAKIGSPESQTGPNTTANGKTQFVDYSQRVGDVPPDVKIQLPTGVQLDPTTNLPAYLAPEVAAVEAWDATKPLPYRAPDPDVDDVFSAGFFDTTGKFRSFDGGFNAAYTPTQVPLGDSNPTFPNNFNLEYPYIEREFYFTTDDSPVVKLPANEGDYGQFVTQYSGAGANAALDWDYSPKKFKLRIPDRFIKLKGPGPAGTLTNGARDLANTNQKWARTQKFIPISLEKQKSFADIDFSTPRAEGAPKPPVLAPVPPGRYCVIGTAGARFFKDPANPKGGTIQDANPNIYTATIGRPDKGSGKFTTDEELRARLTKARRIEMRMAANPANPLPDQQQLVVGSNGGDPKDQIQMGSTYDPFTTEIGRDNELVRNDQTNPVSVFNLTMPGADGKPLVYQPCTAVPVEGMSASEPPWGWAPREEQAAGQEYDIAQKAKDDPAHPERSGWTVAKNVYTFDPRAADGEGAYTTTAGEVSYDKPFDMAPELIRNGTTPNYRTTHLQRLANPQLPWNPLPNQYFDAAGTDLYRPNLPVNPYRTIDSSTVNLTAFNGTSSEEHNIGPTADQARLEGKLRTWIRGGGGGGGEGEIDAYVKGLRGEDDDPKNTTHSAKQAFAFRSVERGFWNRLNSPGWISTPGVPPTLPSTTSPTGTPYSPARPPANPGVATPQRMLWAQEPALVDLRKPREYPPAGTLPPIGELLDLIGGRQMTMRMDEVPQGQTDPLPANDPSLGNTMDDLYAAPGPGNPSGQNLMANHCDMVLKHSLGFGNESFGLLYDRAGLKRSNFPTNSKTSSAPPIIFGSKDTNNNPVPLPIAIGTPAPSRFVFPYDVGPNAGNVVANVHTDTPPTTVNSTYPWMEWDNRPYISAGELLNVPAASQAKMTRQYSPIDPNVLNHPNPYGLSALGFKPLIPADIPNVVPNAIRWAAMQVPFGQLANVLAASAEVADIARNPATGVLLLDTKGNVQPYGAPNFNRILEFVQVPSRFVGTDTMLNAETFNDVPGVQDSQNIVGTALGSDISDASDPRYFFQPPFNKVSRERDPGKVNLNTVTGRRSVDSNGTPQQIWSEVYDGIMHRFHDGNLDTESQYAHFGPAWRDVVLSRRGYIQRNAADAAGIADVPGTFITKSGVLVDKLSAGATPDTLAFGLNNNFPTVFANPFRSPDAGDLVPVAQMVQRGVDASMERVHPRNRGAVSYFDPTTNQTIKNYDSKFGNATPPLPVFGDARDAGLGNDGVSYRTLDSTKPMNFDTIPNDQIPPSSFPTSVATTDVLNHRDLIPLFGDVRANVFTDQNGQNSLNEQPYTDTNRNSYMAYQPMSRLNNLVTNRSGVYAVWITVGYFEVEPAPPADLSKPTDWGNKQLYDHFGGDINLYNRAYPDGYMLGKELGSDTGDVKRPRGFYIIDRTEEVGFKPGEDLNVEKTIRLRRRIE